MIQLGACTAPFLRLNIMLTPISINYLCYDLILFL